MLWSIPFKQFGLQIGNGNIKTTSATFPFAIYTCVCAIKSAAIKSLKSSDLAFISQGYSNWKGSSGEKGCFATCEKCSVH